MTENRPLPNPKKATLITHQNCLDGAGCEVVFRAAGGSPDKIIRVPAGGLDKFYEDSWHSLQDEHLIIADVYPTKDWIWDDLSTRFQPAIVLDHHQSSAKFLKDCRAFVHSSDRCGAEMLLDFLDINDDSFAFLSTARYERLIQFVDMIDRHDRWHNMTQEVEDLALLMRSIGYGEFVNRGAWPDLNHEEHAIIDAERRRLNEKMKKVIERTELCAMNFATCALCIVSEDQSHVLNGVLEAFPQADIVFGINPDDSCVSLRSRPDGVDCAKVAESFGGGGHARAAGFVMKRSVTNVLLNEFVLKNQGAF